MEADDVRQSVSEAYSRVLATGQGCCGPANCCPGGAVPNHASTGLAGYDTREVSGLPADAVDSSFGCGNPVAFADVKAGDTVLDLGSGAGIDLLLAGRKVGPTGWVIGVDMTSDMLERARANIEAAGANNIEVRKGLIEELPVDDASVDLVISNCVINLSPEKHRVFAEISRVLRPGGRMLVSDIVASDLPDWVLTNSELYASCIAGAIDEETYVAGVRDAGLEGVEVRERLVYDASQLVGLIGSEASALSGVAKETLSRAAEELRGKIWSMRIFARKPA